MIRGQAILAAWALVSYDVRASDGTLTGCPLGEDASGLLIYTWLS